MGWLPPEPDQPVAAGPLWIPEGTLLEAIEGYSFATVDELEEEHVVLAVADWPWVDEAGRPRFAGAVIAVPVRRDVLERFLAANRVPRELADRPLRVGDVFALRLRGADERESWEDPEAWIEPPVVDITREARELTKIAYYGAVAPTLGESEAAELIVETEPPPPPQAAF